MKRNKTSFAFVTTMCLCCLIVILRKQVAAWIAVGIVMTQIIVSGNARFCSVSAILSSYSVTTSQNQRVMHVRSQARLVERDPAGYELYEVARFRFWVPRGSSFPVFYDLAEQEGKIYEYDGISVRTNDVVLDAGANVGLYTREALKRGAARVIAIEPAPANLACLKRNFKNEIAAGKVTVYPKGIWDREDVMDMQIDPSNQAADSFVLTPPGASTVIRLPLTTVDNLVKELHLERVDFIKMDIEGAERKALAGASATIQRFRPRMAISVYHLKDDPVVIPALIQSIQPEYHHVSGPCICREQEIKPEVFFFSWAAP